MRYLEVFLLAAATSAALTPLVRRLAFRIGAVDRPTGGRKIHTRAIARLGGLAVAAGFGAATLVFLPLDRRLLGLLAGAGLILAVGAIDDIYNLKPWIKLVCQLVAAVVTLAGGIGISALTNPLGGAIGLTWGRTLVSLGGLRFHITPLANLLSLVWIVGLVNVINFLDGIDGLATGVSGIAGFVIFLLALAIGQPAVAVIALAVAGAAAGFLPFNFSPASIFLGDSGAYFFGLILALLAIYSGGKLATAFLVLGFTIIDGLLTVLRRLYHRGSPFQADRTHLHHLLLDSGLSQRQTVLIFYLFSLTFGLVALVSGTLIKLVATILLVVMMAIVVNVLLRRGPKLPPVSP